MRRNPKTVEELKKTAVIYWPSELSKKEQKSSIIPLLLKTQDKFISVLDLSSKTPYTWKDILGNIDDIYPNLFLKHLCVLSDIGGESLKRFATELPSEFEDKDFEFVYQDETYSHKFKSLFEGRKWSNTSLGLDGKGLLKRFPINQSIIDVSMLIMFGSLTTNSFLPKEIEGKCIIGTMLGKKEEIEKFVKERYIWVSRITGGSTANKMGHLAQEFVKNKLQNYLPSWDFSKSTIPGISQNEGRTLTKFDIVGTAPNDIHWGIEVSFQFTTNSTVERKAKLAQDRQNLLHAKGHKVAYVIDGAGNFERRSFVQDLIDYSDCAVNFNEDDLKRLAETMERSMYKDGTQKRK